MNQTGILQLPTKATRVQRVHEYIKTDGGRAEAGFPSHKLAKAYDCVARSLAVATGRPYSVIWHEVALVNFMDSRRKIAAFTADMGVWTEKRYFLEYMKQQNFEEIDIYEYRNSDLPPTFNEVIDLYARKGTFIVRIYAHTFALKDGMIYDMYNPVASGRPKVIQLWKYEGPNI